MLTPLIDTALTLLVIFMVAAPVLQRGIKVDLPKGNSKEVKGKQELVVTITKDAKLFFNSFPVEKKKLASTVKKEFMGRDDEPVYVRIHGPFDALQYELDKDRLKKSTTDVLEKEAKAKAKQKIEEEKQRLKKKADEELKRQEEKAKKKLEDSLKDKLKGLF
jgi:hypothetical protein